MSGYHEFAQVVFWTVGAIGGVVAAFRAIAEMRQGREQREVEHRWRQVQQARALLQEIQEDYLARSALKMLDWSGRTFDIHDGSSQPVSFDDVVAALRTENLSFNAKEGFVRDCFDALFERMESIEHFIVQKLITFYDVRAPLDYYAKILSRESSYRAFMTEYGYDLAVSLLNKFNATHEVV